MLMQNTDSSALLPYTLQRNKGSTIKDINLARLSLGLTRVTREKNIWTGSNCKNDYQHCYCSKGDTLPSLRVNVQSELPTFCVEVEQGHRAECSPLSHQEMLLEQVPCFGGNVKISDADVCVRFAFMNFALYIYTLGILIPILYVHFSYYIVISLS